jgi:hypothetical protein
MTLARRLGICLLVLAFTMAPRAVMDAARAQAPQNAAAYDEEFERARQLLQRHEYFNALKGFQRANQLAGGKSAEAFLGMAQAMHGM